MHSNRSQNTHVPSSAEATTPFSPSRGKDCALKTNLITRSPAAPSTQSKNPKISKSPKKPTKSVIYYPQQNVLPSQDRPAPPQQTNAQPPANPTTQTPKKRKPHDLDRPRSTWIDRTRHSAPQPPDNRRESGVCVSRRELARTGNRLQKRKN